MTTMKTVLYLLEHNVCFVHNTETEGDDISLFPYKITVLPQKGSVIRGINLYKCIWRKVALLV